MTTKRRATTSPTLEETEEPPAPPSISFKRRRRCLTIEEKIKLLDYIEGGERPADLARDHDISESAIRMLQRSEKQLRDFAAQCTANTFKSSSYIPRDSTLERAEQLVFAWYEKQRAKGQTQTIARICAKARQFWSELKAEDAAETNYSDERNDNDDDANDDDEEAEEQRNFKASKGWFTKFRKRYNLDFKSCHETAPIDTVAARNYPAIFRELVAAGGYQPQQVFNAGECSLAWKRMPARSTVAQRDRPRNKVGYDRVSLLLCGNVTGDLYLKPLLVYRTLTPYCLRSRAGEDLPVFWRARNRQSQRTPKMMAAHFQDWMTECFVPRVRDYLESMKLPVRCLLLLDAELAEFDLQLDDAAAALVQLEFLPPNTSPLLQPVGLSVVPIFKCHYTRRLFAHFIRCLEAPADESKAQNSLFKLWLNFDISEGIDIINDSLEEITAECWNGGWLQLWKQIVTDKSYSNSSALTYEIQRIVDIGCNLPGPGFADMTMDDMQAHLKMERNWNSKFQKSKAVSVKCQTAKAREESVFESQLGDGDEEYVEIDEETIEYIDDQFIISNEQETMLPIRTQNLNSDEFSDGNELDYKLEETVELIAESDTIKSLLTNNQLTISEPETKPESILPMRIKRTYIRSNLTHNSNSDPADGRNSKKANSIPIVQNINKALALSQQLIAAIGQVDSSRREEFVNGLNALMLPYREIKERLQQPSIRDYFAT